LFIYNFQQYFCIFSAFNFSCVIILQIAFCRNSGSDQEKVVDSIKDEFGLMTKLNHPNIVRILGATQEGCHFNMFVEWMPGLYYSSF
jgi:mitogen-activated protein kinase kinase kinase 1